MIPSDLGIYLYTTEKTAVDEYWFDVNDQVFADNYTYNGAPLSVASRFGETRTMQELLDC